MPADVAHFVIAALGAWKLGAVLVTMNRCTREAEAAHLLSDSGAVVVVASQRGYHGALAPVLEGTSVRVSVTTSEVDVLGRLDPRVFGDLTEEPVPGTDDLLDVARSAAGRAFDTVPARPADVAVLCYTSGRTGPAKGAMLTHANIATTIALNSQWLGTGSGDVIYGAAPLFHVVGLGRAGPRPAPVRHACAALPDPARGHGRAPDGIPAEVPRLPTDGVHRAHGRSGRERRDLRVARPACMPVARCSRPRSSTVSRSGSASTSTTATG